jgi:predicted amidohydrolase YtcJ
MSGAPHLLVNAVVRVGDESDRRADALAWRDGRLLAAGNRAEVEKAAGAGAETHDAGGATVVPGFIDAHHHPSIYALYGGLVRLTPPEVTNIESLQRVLGHAAAALGPGEWLVATDWDELLLDERRPPTRSELDDAVPDRPLMALHYGCHRALANSRALELAGIGRDTPDPSGGEIARGPNGVPNGLLIERGISRVESLARASLLSADLDGFLQRLAAHHRALVGAGITRVVDAAVPADLAELYREAQRRGLLIVPTVMLPVSAHGYFEAPWDALEGPVTGETEGLLATGPLKLVLDGAPTCAMCLGWWQTAGFMLSTWALSVRQRSFDAVRTALSVSPRYGWKIRTGIHIYSEQETLDVVKRATDRGFSLATHAVGNAATDVALAAFEATGEKLHRHAPPRIEHATFLSRAQVERIAAVGASVVAQPHFLSLPAFGSAPKIPGLGTLPNRWLLDHGVVVAGSSDFPVAAFSPLDGIRSAVTRRTARGRVLEAEQAVSVDEALAMYTRSAARVSGCATECGSLEAGKRADFVVLDGDLAAEARVRGTVIAGELVFGRLSE